MGWRAVTALEIAVLAAAMAAGTTAPSLWERPRNTRCAGGDDPVAAAGQKQRVEIKPTQWRADAQNRITTQNRRAEGYARAGRAVRTVVLFVPSPPADVQDTIFDGTIPEMRGIAMWQKRLNDDARSDDTRVPLRVDVRSAGPGYRDVVAAVDDLVKEVGQVDHGKDYAKVVGVLGFAQSTTQTRDAVERLGRADIRMPTIGTTATADEMQRSETFWPLAPETSQEARIAADFASQANIVADTGKPEAPAACVPAEQAVIVQNSGDLYSKSLADKFRDSFKGDEDVINFAQGSSLVDTPPGTQKASSPDRLAGQVCTALQKNPATVVYWTSRARDFTAFANAWDAKGTCGENRLTVLGGNELTNVALTGEYHNKTWLRLYHSAHRLPEGDLHVSEKTQDFINGYHRTYPKDPWLQDGQSAVAYDAFHALSMAADDAHAGAFVDRDALVTGLKSGERFDGATGFVDFSADSNEPPQHKSLVILKQTPEGPRTVVVCGAYGPSAEPGKQGAPCPH